MAGGHVHEIKSALILQPGPAALTDGVEAIQRIIGDWAAATRTPFATRFFSSSSFSTGTPSVIHAGAGSPFR